MKQKENETTVTRNEELLKNYYDAHLSCSVPTGAEMTIITFENNYLVYQERERAQDKIVEEIPDNLKEDIILYLNNYDEETWKPLMHMVTKPPALMELDREVRDVVQACGRRKISLHHMLAEIEWIINKREEEEREAEERAYRVWKDFSQDVMRYYRNRWDDDEDTMLKYIKHFVQNWD